MQAIQKWGNSLAIRIPAKLAQKAHFHVGTLVELSLEDHRIIMSSTGKQKLTLQERLELFDIKKHGGESMVTGRIGLEKF